MFQLERNIESIRETLEQSKTCSLLKRKVKLATPRDTTESDLSTISIVKKIPMTKIILLLTFDEYYKKM